MEREPRPLNHIKERHSLDVTCPHWLVASRGHFSMTTEAQVFLYLSKSWCHSQAWPYQASLMCSFEFAARQKGDQDFWRAGWILRGGALGKGITCRMGGVCLSVEHSDCTAMKQCCAFAILLCCMSGIQPKVNLRFKTGRNLENFKDLGL